MCGIVAILLADPSAAVNQEIYDALTALQHRGQDAAGIVTADQRRRLHLHKDSGLVRDVFKLQHMINLIGNVGLGHVRYPTAGASTNVHEAQPFVTNIPFGICLAHNGNITNARELQDELRGRYHFNTDSDSELLLSVFADELLRQESKEGLTNDLIFSACRGLMSRVRGGFAAQVLINGYGILAFRDPWGIRPLCYGSREAKSFLGTSKKDWGVASESVALECLDFDVHGDVKPGEAVFISLRGETEIQMCHDNPTLSPCIFEYVYFGRPDSTLDGVSVYEARKLMGDHLAEKIKRLHDVSEIDVVVPVPETSRVSALQCALKLGVNYEEGLNKNRYIARTFIMPGQQKRKKNVRKKLNPISSVFKDKNVMLVDDSIVRGTTSEQIVSMVRAAGAKKVFFCSASPAIRYPNVYGIDMPVQSELIAFGREESEIAEAIKADWVVYQDLEDMVSAVSKINPAIQNFDTSCFNGVYVTGDVNADYFQALKDKRSDSVLGGASGGSTDDVDGLPTPTNNHSSGKLTKQMKELTIAEGDENGGDVSTDGVKAAVSSGQLGRERPRGRLIGGQRSAKEQLAAMDPQNSPKGMKNEDMEKLRDRFSGWV